MTLMKHRGNFCVESRNTFGAGGCGAGKRVLRLPAWPEATAIPAPGNGWLLECNPPRAGNSSCVMDHSERRALQPSIGRLPPAAVWRGGGGVGWLSSKCSRPALAAAIFRPWCCSAMNLIFCWLTGQRPRSLRADSSICSAESAARRMIAGSKPRESWRGSCTTHPICLETA